MSDSRIRPKRVVFINGRRLAPLMDGTMSDAKTVLGVGDRPLL